VGAARLLSRQRTSTAALEQELDELLSGADQAMVEAFTGGFRVAQTKLAINKVLPEPLGSAALESAQVVALGILVREQMDAGRFAALYRPFATVLPGPGYELPPPIDRQIALFMQKLPQITGDAKTEVTAVAKVLTEPPKTPAAPGPSTAGAAPLGAPAADHGVAGLYAAAWKLAIDTAHSSGRTISFRAAQDLAEQAAPHDGSGIVGTAGVAAGAIFMRDLLPIEKVLLLYEPFAVAFPYETLR
jgi:hypothetical protein